MKDLKELSKPLTTEQLEFRVSQVFKGKNNKVWANILVYKNARTDAKILDDVVGPENWQLKFREEKACIVASLGIRTKEGVDDWAWKEGNGTPGDFEQEKGAYSDAQKRAGFQWGIGRGLYDFPQIYVELLEGECYEKDGKVFADKKLRPQDWDWNVKYKADGSVEELNATFKNNSRFNHKSK